MRFRSIWRIEGPNPGGGDEVGGGLGSVGDINNDGIGDFAVRYGKLAQWRVYLGAFPVPDTTADWIFEPGISTPPHPIVGDFWGTGRTAVGFPSAIVETIDDNRKVYVQFHIFRTEDDSLPNEASAILDPHRTMDGTLIQPAEALAADLDDDGADEFILINSLVHRGEWSRHIEIWIYKGGASFQVDTPTHIIREPQPNGVGGNITCRIGDVDGDLKPDLLLSTNHPDGAKLNFWWGADGAPWSWNLPDRTLLLQADGRALTTTFRLLDCDGDGAQDLLIASGTGPRIYRSGSGKSPRSRSFTTDDIDVALRRKDYTIFLPLGPLNDVNRRYDMVGLTSIVTNTMLALSGSPNGPDLAYEASFDDGFGFIFSRSQPLGDVNGDGWHDAIVGNQNYFFESGVAAVLGGGPYIPQDHTAGVQHLASEGRDNVITIWPNPMREELNIAWRGDLQRMPARFEVHDLLGRIVARGDVEPGAGAALWRGSEIRTGTYILSVFDRAQELFASIPVIKVG